MTPTGEGFRFELEQPALSVPVWVGRDLDAAVLAQAHPPRTGGVLVADAALREVQGPRLERLCAALLGPAAAAPLWITAGEASKEASALPAHWEALAARGLDRRGRVLVAGGGSLLDLGAFLGGTYLRGVETFLLPTTLLAQVDAALGGKCGVNLGTAKNQVGLIRQPAAIVADTSFLDTLPAEELQSGQGEVLKTALLSGGALHDAVREPVADWGALVPACLRYKADIVRRDEHEGGLRRILNLGHTLGHVLESLALAQGLGLPHGVAVGLGLLAETAGGRGEEAGQAVAALLARHGLPTSAPAGLRAPRDEVLALLQSDKKREGALLRVPLLIAPGEVEDRACAPEQVAAWLETVLSAT